MKNLVLRNLLFFTTIIVVLELCAYLIFEYFLTDRLSQHWKLSPNIVISNLDEDSTIDYRRQFFDPDLGWIFHKNTNAIPYATFDNLGARFDPENGIGDMCELPDCNLNGIPDECDIASGTSADYDLNGEPDECQLDCNENGIPDFYEIEEGLITDCNGNEIPDNGGLLKRQPR